MKSLDNVSVLDNIKKARIAIGLNQEEMAVKLGIATVNYGKIERGKTQMTIERLYQIADLLNVTVADLLDIEISKSEEKRLKEEIDQLKRTIAEMKDDIIDLLSDNNLLMAASAGIYTQTEEYTQSKLKRLEEFQKGNYFFSDSNQPYDKDKPESMREYLSRNLKFGRRR